MLRLVLFALALVALTSCPKPPPPKPPPQAPEDVGKLAPPAVSPSPEVRDAVQLDLGGRRSWLRSVSHAPLASPLLHALLSGVSFVATCAQCREKVLEADRIGDEEECVLRDHPLGGTPQDRAARDARRVAQALRCDRGAAAGSVAALQGGWQPLDFAQEFGDGCTSSKSSGLSGLVSKSHSRHVAIVMPRSNSAACAAPVSRV